jgi:CubicO group peptidase (beta-lactamase class C family)
MSMANQPPPKPRPSRRSVLGAAMAGGLLAFAGKPQVFSGRAAAETSVDPLPQALLKDLGPGGAFDKLLARLAAEDRFSGTVLLAYQGEPVLTRWYGMADKDRALPNGPDTIFNLASVTKTFTTVAIAQLAEQAKIAYHAALGTHLDGFPPEIANTVTVQQLLTHTSGVGRPPLGGGPPPGIDWTSFEQAMAETLDTIRNTPLRFTPGSQYSYSNDEFWVLGAIVEKVAGQSFFDYVRKRIFRFAGMTRSDYYSKPQVLSSSGIAHPYLTQPDGGRIDFSTTEFFPYTTGPAGGAYSTVTDLLRFARALSAGSLVNPRFVNLATSGKIALPPSPAEPETQVLCYGYGFIDAIVHNQRAFGHPGDAAGVATRLEIYPDLHFVSIILSNYDNAILPLVALQRRLVTA